MWQRQIGQAKERKGQDEVRDRGSGRFCDTLWTVVVTELYSTVDHRGGRHTFLISWEGFNFLWVHDPPTDQHCH